MPGKRERGRSGHGEREAYTLLVHFPTCPYVVEIAAGRDCQLALLDPFMSDVANIVRTGAELRPITDQAQYR